jgi:ribonuclease BN (tRNA processing enzyme)
MLKLLACSLVLACAATAQAPPATHTQLVVLGTGTPEPYPDRAGASVAIVVNGAAYLVDCGTGVVKRAEAAEQNGIKALNVKNLKIVFLTHLHTDHTLGYPDLIFSPWVLHRRVALEAYGPRGLKSMTSHILKAWQQDIHVRTTGLEEANHTGYRVEVHEISPGVVYQDQNVKVTAFPVKHGSWKQAFGYRFDTPDRSIVLSGDTAPTDAVVKACNGCDVLLHEVYNPKGAEMRQAHWQEYFAAFHTSPQQLGDIARRAHPKLLVLYHQVLEHLPEQDLVEQVGRYYQGKFVSAHDLGVY